jgi:hypothetical protein
MRTSIFIGVILSAILIIHSCSQKQSHQLIFKFKFDPTQERLGNIGQPVSLPAGHAAQNPTFNTMSAHYIELAADKFTALGTGAVLYKAAETTAGGASGIDFDLATKAKDEEVFYSMPLASVKPGTYEWLRVSLAYQNFDVDYYMDTTINTVAIKNTFKATLAGFIGFNSYIRKYLLKTQEITVNANKLQGYWGAETTVTIPGYSNTFTQTGQAPGTTVVNPIFASSPIPSGSCVVTGAFTPGKLTITGNETGDVVVTVSLSTNKSFEWLDKNGNQRWDALQGEPVVDMGIRGMKPIIGN